MQNRHFFVVWLQRKIIGGTLPGKRVKYITVCENKSREKGGYLYGKG